MSYRLINANSIVFNSDGFITAENIEKMPCIYADLPNGMDGEHYVLEQEPKTDTIDKIRAEIDAHREKLKCMADDDWYAGKIRGYDCAIEIIDKYKAESEET